MNSTFRFINVYFWKSIYAPFMAFILPAVLLVVLGKIFRVEYAFPGIISLSVLLITILIIPLTLSDLKKTSTLKFFGTSPVGKLRFSIVVFLYFVAITAISISILFMVLLAAFSNEVFVPEDNNSFWIVSDANPGAHSPAITLDSLVYYNRSILSWMLTPTGFWMFLFSVCEQAILGIAIGLLIVTIAKTPQLALTISIGIILPTMFLSGMIISVDIIATSPALKWISRFIPFTYTTGNVVEAMTPVSHINVYISGNFDSTASTVPGEQYSGAIKALIRRTSATGEGGTIIDGTRVVNTAGTNNTKLIQMIGEQYNMMKTSSKNIFDFSTDYVVRKVPEPDKIRDFIETFLQPDFAGQYKNSQVSDLGKFMELWNDFIKKGDYDFLNLFFNQNNILYTGVEKALNIFIPVVLSAGAFWYSVKHFKWSVR